jgi:hypothetical protein
MKYKLQNISLVLFSDMKRVRIFIDLLRVFGD